MPHLVGTWTFTDPERPLDTSTYTLDVGTRAIEPIASRAVAVYYAAIEPGGRDVMFLHNDLDRSEMSRHRFDGQGRLVEQGRWPSGGNGGSYIAFDATGAYFAVANARTGWAVFRNAETPDLLALLSNHGCGPHPRQAGSHPHCIVFSPDNRWLYATDMGTDEVLAFPFDPATGAVGTKRVAWSAAPGAGPRHILFHQGLAYLLNELDNTLVVLAIEDGGHLAALQTVRTIPDDFHEFSHTAHLAVSIDGTTILVSNRGHDSIAFLALSDVGRVIRTAWTSCGGIWPWHFTVEPDATLLVANMKSNAVSIIDLPPQGEPAVSGTIPIDNPVFILK